MTEQQLRHVLARAVPEPPDSVADPAPETEWRAVDAGGSTVARRRSEDGTA